MEERPKSDTPPRTRPDDLADGWTRARTNGKRPKPSEAEPPPQEGLDELEDRLHAGWDAPPA